MWQFFRNKYIDIIMNIRLLLVMLLIIGAGRSYSQVLDRIVAVIGDEVILASDVEDTYNYVILNGEKDDGTLRCRVLENLIVDKLMLNKAEQDSLVLSEGQVDAEVNRRVDYILNQMDGNQKEFEEIYGKPVLKFKDDIRPEIEDQILINQQRSQIIEEAKITPREVKEFFKSIPVDSLGLLPAEVQLNHIVINVPWSEESKDQAREELADLRKQIANKEGEFADLARRYSDDGGTGRRGGMLGTFGRGQMVPKFEEVAYGLREGDLSDIFETEFGYHIIQLHKRQGELITASHILKKPRPDVKGDSLAIEKLNEIRELIDQDSLSFEEAAIVFSQDRATKDCGGCITNPKQPGELSVPLDALPADMYFKVEEMEPGEISEPLKLDEISAGGRVSYHMIYLKKKIPPHAPNLKDDYKTIYNAALRSRQGEIMENWLELAKKNIYIDIKPNECTNALKNWIN